MNLYVREHDNTYSIESFVNSVKMRNEQERKNTMATMTAQILVGMPHPNHGGINPTHYLFLSENSRPAWQLIAHTINPVGNGPGNRLIWIPTLEHMLEDAFLMIAIHVVQNHAIVALAEGFNPNAQADGLELYEAFTESQREKLYATCRGVTEYPKVIISAFRGSHILGQLQTVQQYQMDVEVCPVRYSRLHNQWDQEVQIDGTL